MKLSELRQIVHDLTEQVHSNYGPDIDPDVRLATQPRYPLQFNVDALEVCHVDEDRESNGHIIYIFEGSPCANPYLPRVAQDLWGR